MPRKLRRRKNVRKQRRVWWTWVVGKNQIMWDFVSGKSRNMVLFSSRTSAVRATRYLDGCCPKIGKITIKLSEVW